MEYSRPREPREPREREHTARPGRPPLGQALLGCLLLLGACSESEREPAADHAESGDPADHHPPAPVEARSLRLTVPLGTGAPAGDNGRRLARPRTVVVLAGETSILQTLGSRLETAFEERQPEYDLRLRSSSSRTAVGLSLTGQADAALLLGELTAAERERGMQQSQVGRWALGLFTHPDVLLQPLTRAQVCDLFTGQVRQWSMVGGGRGEVRLVLPEPGPAAELAARFLTSGEALGTSSLLAADPESAVTMLRLNPGSLGVVPLASVDVVTGLRQVLVEGKRPGVSSGWPYAADVYLATLEAESEFEKTLGSLLRAMLGGE